MQYGHTGPEKSNSLTIAMTDEEMCLVLERVKPRFEGIESRADMIETLKMFLTFDLSSYKDYKESLETAWREKFYDVDRVLAKMTAAETSALITVLFLGHIAIKDAMDVMMVQEKQTAVLHQLNNYIGELILNLDKEVQLFQKVLRYALTLNPPFMENFGKREQDSPEYSFNKDEVNVVHAIVIVAKMFMPLFTALLKISKEPSTRVSMYGDRFSPIKGKAKLIDKRIKENFCMNFIEPLFYVHIEGLYLKLLNYIEKFVEVSKLDPSKQNSTQVFRNNTTEELVKMATSYIICRRCVKYNLSSPMTNIMGVIHRGAKSVDQVINSEAVYFQRTAYAPDESPATKESTLELGSTRSKTTADEELYIEMTAKRILLNRLKVYEIDRALFDEVFEFNLSVHKEIEPFMETLLNNAFSTDFESCYCVKALSYHEIIRLCTLIQLICFKKGWWDIAFRIMATRKIVNGVWEMRDQMNDIEGGKIRYNTASYASAILDELKSCYTRTLNDEKKVTSLYEESKKMIETIAKYFTDYTVYYKVAPRLQQMAAQTIPSTASFILRTKLIEEFCKVLEGL